jgi:hypothetical protein
MRKESPVAVEREDDFIRAELAREFAEHKARLAAVLDERDTLKEALQKAAWWLDAQNEPRIEVGWEKAVEVIDSALCLSAADELGSSSAAQEDTGREKR